MGAVEAPVSVATHFDVLAIYGASAVRVVPTEGDPEDLLGEGGGLQDAFDRFGQRPLLAVLRDPRVASVVLADGELQVTAARDGADGRLSVRWGEDAVVDERVQIPPPQAAAPGPWFRPEPTSEVDATALHDVGVDLMAVEDVAGTVRWYTAGLHGPGIGQVRLLATIPAAAAEDLGSVDFRGAHGVRWAYVAGAMAGGISSADLVIAMAKAGLLAFFGSGGLPVPAVKEALRRIREEAGSGAWGFNLLHNPTEPAVEEETIDLYLEHGVRRVSASAYMGLTKAVVRFRLSGLRRGADGRPVCDHHVFAKVSRPEVAEKFLRPAPPEMVEGLRAAGAISDEQAELALLVPVAEDITAEADSGGHTDHRALVVLVPSLMALRDRITAEQGYAEHGIHPRVGAAGGLGTPHALHATFALGADYVLTGSVNQATVEAGTSPMAKEMLSDAGWWEVSSGPAPDMFELGAKVQVLSRGSMYAQRAQRLYDLYKAYDGFEAIPDKDRARIEKQLFRRPLEDVWADTRKYWQQREPAQAERGDTDARHRMALTFRWYLGMTSRWARVGEDDRKRDFQVWCGPAMGGFNEWVAGSAIEDVAQRTVVGVAEALMHGAVVLRRVRVAEALGVPLSQAVRSIPVGTGGSPGA